MYKIGLEVGDIVIPKEYTLPNENKLRRYMTKRVFNPIVVDNNNVLVDGYITYLIESNNGLNAVVECYRTLLDKPDIKMYVFGVHPNQEFDKEYVWTLDDKVLLTPGTKVLAQSKFGIVPVIVTRCELMDKSPVDIPVKKIVRWRNVH